MKTAQEIALAASVTLAGSRTVHTEGSQKVDKEVEEEEEEEERRQKGQRVKNTRMFTHNRTSRVIR